MDLDLQRRARSSLNPELTPLIDVVFQLLVFFLLTTSFSLPAVPLALPAARTGQEKQEQGTIVISITREGNIFLGDSLLPEAKIEAVVTQRVRLAPFRPVVVRGDIESRYGLFVKVLDACRRAGAARVLLETSPARVDGGPPLER